MKGLGIRGRERWREVGLRWACCVPKHATLSTGRCRSVDTDDAKRYPHSLTILLIESGGSGGWGSRVKDDPMHVTPDIALSPCIMNDAHRLVISACTRRS